MTHPAIPALLSDWSGLLHVWGHVGLHFKFWASLGYVGRLYFVPSGTVLSLHLCSVMKYVRHNSVTHQGKVEAEFDLVFPSVFFIDKISILLVIRSPAHLPAFYNGSRKTRGNLFPLKSRTKGCCAGLWSLPNMQKGPGFYPQHWKTSKWKYRKPIRNSRE